ncbi:MAG: autotransporter outer membrane beta-barrel domain-containing protein, partial [Opitutaceae bacterium]|nr:autotransporter outer membrane beta-barrel domain-containing protein [Opitutaceae bacterium]
SIASLEERLLGVRAMYMKVSREKQFWVTGYYRDEQLAGLRYDRHTTAPRIDIGTMGVQAGVDWVAAPDPSFIFIYGISADYAISDIRLPGGRTNTTTGDTASMGAGVYGSLVSGPWHIDALLRYGAQDYEATAARVAPISTSSQSWSGMISVGRDIPLGKAAKWKLEPAARFVYQRNNNFTDVTDSAGRLYTTSGIFSNELRASIRLSRDGAWKKNLRCAPYVRAGCTYDFATDGRITVAGEDFDHGFSGAGMEAGGGLLLEVRNDILLQAAFSWFDTDVSRGIAATAGISFTW